MDALKTGTTMSGQPLQTRLFAATPTLIPQMGSDGRWNGRIVKVELVLLRGLDGGARMHLWLGPDPRPHNHPWHWIDCKVVRGSYVAIEYVPDGEGGYDERVIPLSAGNPEHRVQHDTHHQIVSVQPGTLSVMSFGSVVGDGKQWGHLVKDANGFCYEPAPSVGSSSPGGYIDALRHCNPHLRPVDWADPYADMPVPDVNTVVDGLNI